METLTTKVKIPTKMSFVMVVELNMAGVTRRFKVM